MDAEPTRTEAARSGALRAEAGVERMLRLVEAVPAGLVLTYGDVAALSGYGGPRTAGQVMARHGAGVPWHRVVDASGRAPAAHRARARRAWADEGTPVRGPADDRVVDLRRARWSPAPEVVAALMDGIPWPAPDRRTPEAGCAPDASPDRPSPHHEGEP